MAHPGPMRTGPAWIRLLPQRPPPGRAYVAQDPHCHVIAGAEDLGAALRRALHQVGEGGLVLTEWDIAYDLGDRRALEAAITRLPHQVVAAPYRLWPVSTGLQEPVWAHRVSGPLTAGGFDPDAYRWVRASDRFADLFGLGLTYLPWEAVQLATSLQLDWRGADVALSLGWGRGAFICWEARPTHLHW